MRLQDYLVPYIISQVIALLLIFVCYKWPRIGKIVLVILFFAAGVFNLYAAFNQPQVYVEAYGPAAVFLFYKKFIFGIFSKYATLFVSLIASGQIIVAILLFQRGFLFKLGSIGGMIFLIAISPLGIGSAFPSTILMAISLFLLLRASYKI